LQKIKKRKDKAIKEDPFEGGNFPKIKYDTT